MSPLYAVCVMFIKYQALVCNVSDGLEDNEANMPSSMGAQITDLLASTVEISNLMSVLSVLAALLVMLVFLTRLIYQVGVFGLCQMSTIDQFQKSV